MEIITGNVSDGWREEQKLILLEYREHRICHCQDNCQAHCFQQCAFEVDDHPYLFEPEYITNEELIQIEEQTRREKERQQAEGELSTVSLGYMRHSCWCCNVKPDKECLCCKEQDTIAA